MTLLKFTPKEEKQEPWNDWEINLENQTLEKKTIIGKIVIDISKVFTQILFKHQEERNKRANKQVFED